MERHRDLLKQGAVLVNESDPGEDARVLFFLEHSVQDARPGAGGQNRLVSRRMVFVEIGEDDNVRSGGQAPYLDYRAIADDETPLVADLLDSAWLKEGLEQKAVSYAIGQLVPGHLNEVRARKEDLVDKTMSAVKDRLTKEINHWDYRATELQAQEQAGKVNAKLNSAKARARADELQARLQKRMTELEQERKLAPLPPVVTGGALVVPAGLLARLRGDRAKTPATFAKETDRVEAAAMQAVMEAERQLGYVPTDVVSQKLGYDVESVVPGTGKLRFLEVKGRVKGASTVTITKNEILTAFNKPDDFILALVQVPASEDFGETDAFQVGEEHATYGEVDACTVRYLRHPFHKEPDFGVTSVNYGLRELLERATPPS